MNVLGIGMDLVAISILVFVLYFPRHRRRDLVVAYLMINTGLFAVTSALVVEDCLLYTSPSPRDGLLSRMPSSA